MYDLKIWFKTEKNKYIPIILISIYVVLAVNADAKSLGTEAGVVDYMFRLFMGTVPYVPKFEDTWNNPFRVSPLYVLFNFYLSWLISYYPLREMKSMGKYIILKNGTKFKWWINKCVWMVSLVISCYVVVLVVFGVASAFNGTTGTDCNIALIKCAVSMSDSENIDFDAIENLSAGGAFAAYILLPMVASAGISMIQMMLSLVVGQVYSQVIVFAVYVCSAFSCKVYLPGNFLMYLRNEKILLESGVCTAYGLILGACLISVGVFCSLYLIRKKDII